MKLSAAIKTIRPQQWIKNIFVFLPVFFHGDLLNKDKIILAVGAFLVFSFASSSIYCLNDLNDVESDRKHPIKRFRPLASREISKTTTILLMILLLISAIGVAIFYGGANWKRLLLVVGSYYVMNVAYSFYLKRIAIIDVFIISLGFVIRVVAGGIATSTFLSQWIILMTFLLSLFIAFAKRRDDVLILNDSGEKTRGNINRYNLEFINSAMIVVATVTMVSYIMYTVSDEVIERFGTGYLYITSLFVLLGLFRYLQRTLVDSNSGDPVQILLNDRFIWISIAGWLLSFFFIIYV